MTHRKRLALLILLCGILAAVALSALLNQPHDTPRPPARSIFPAGTPTPEGYRPGIVIVRDLFSGAGVTVTPMPGVVGSHIEIYWDDVQPSLSATPDWSAIEARVAYLDSQDRDAWLSLEFFETVWSNTDTMHVPSGVPTVSYSGYIGSTPCPEIAPDYGATGFRNAYATVVASMMAEFGDDPRVAGFAIQMGASGEAMNVQNDSCTKRQYFETPVPCQEWLDAVVLAGQWHRAGTDKPLTLAAGIAGCYQSSYNEDRKVNKYLFEKLNGTPGAVQFVGYRHNGLGTDNQRAFFSTPTPGAFGRMQYGYAHPDEGGVSFEPGSPAGFPTQVPTAEREGYADYLVLNAANAKADNIFLQKQWYPYIDSRVLDTITRTLGTTAADSPMAWVWFRGAEFYKTIDSATISYSGYPDPFTHLAAVVGNATPTTYCAPGVRATAQAVGGSTPPDACAQTLSVPAARESRNVLGYQAGSTVGIDIADDWANGGNINAVYELSLRYLDNNSGSVVVAWKDTGGNETTHTISKANTGIWQTETFTVTAALNDQYTTHDLELRPAGAIALLSSLLVTYQDTDSTPTPTPSPSPTPTATNTRTPRPTATYVTATPTRTPTATPNWPAVNCPAITPAVNGTLAEWGSATPVVLSKDTALLIQPPTPVAGGIAPPTSADASATLYCGYAGNVIYLAGTVLDDVTAAGTTYTTTGNPALGDALRITLDGARDGFSRFAEDDHDLYVTPAGRVLDWATLPISVTVATGTTAGGWTFELAIDASTLELGTLGSGSKYGLVWHVYDADDQGGIQHILDDRKRMATLQ